MIATTQLLGEASKAVPMFVLILVFVFLVLRYGGRTGRWLMGGLALLALIAFFIAIPSVRQAQVAYDSAARTVGSEGPSPFYQSQSGSSYIDPNDRHADRARTDELNPDVFPSAGTAAIQCARKALLQYMCQAPDGDNLKTVHVRVSPDPRDQARVITALKKEYSGLRFVKDKAASSEPAESDATQALLEVTADSTTSNGATSYLVEARLAGAHHEFTQQARVKNKSWVENSADWQDVIFVDPPLLGSSPADVQMNAIAVAAEQLEPYVLGRPAALGISPRSLSCRQLIENTLRGGGGIRDEFLQRLEPGYGVVYRTALLVDASQGRLDALARQYASFGAAESQHDRRSIVSAAGLVAVILLIYLFLNAATKGYYVWSLRIGSVVIIAAGILMVIKLT